LQFNSDTGSNYSVTDLYGNGTSAASVMQSASYINVAGASNLSSTIPHFYSIDVFSYSGSTSLTLDGKSLGNLARIS
jgi:hypothetical protein